MVRKYFEKVESIGTQRMLAIMVSYFLLMLILVYSYRVIITDRQYTSAHDLTQEYLEHDKVSSLE